MSPLRNRFVTFNLHSGSDYLNPDWTWEVTEWYINLFRNNYFPHASLSVGPYTAYFWKNGNIDDYDGDFEGLTSQQIELFKTFLREGGGLLYDETDGVSKIPPFYADGMNAPAGGGYSLEQIINAGCRSLTENFDPLTGDKLANATGKFYGIDAAFEYLGKAGQSIEVHPTISKQSLARYWSAYLCGAERAEFSGWATYSPVWLDPVNWKDSYINDFKQTPFFWCCGLLTFISFKPATCDYNDPFMEFIPKWEEMQLEDDTSQRNWCFETPLERWNFLASWLTNNAYNNLQYTGIRDIPVGAYISAGMGQNTHYDWSYPIEERSLSEYYWRNYRIATDVLPYKPSTLPEAHLIDDMQGTSDTAMGEWRDEFTAAVGAVVDFSQNSPYKDSFYFVSDKEAMDLVVKQYDPDNPITVTKARVLAIADYLANIYPLTTPWQFSFNEWTCDPVVNITRPPNYVDIEIGGETEYYSLSEAWWHMLAGLYDIVTTEDNDIHDHDLEPAIGPCEPSVYPTETNEEEMYRLPLWAQHDEYNGVHVKWIDIKKAVQVLFLHATTDSLGPIYPDNTRQKNLRKVAWRWPLEDESGNRIWGNASECLYIMAKAIRNWYDNPSSPVYVGFFPSHVLPRFYYERQLWNGQLPVDMFGSTLDNQLAWLDLGQMWTMKPAVLLPDYR